MIRHSGCGVLIQPGFQKFASRCTAGKLRIWLNWRVSQVFPEPQGPSTRIRLDDSNISTGCLLFMIFAPSGLLSGTEISNDYVTDRPLTPSMQCTASQLRRPPDTLQDFLFLLSL
jgi:hypothetical protein